MITMDDVTPADMLEQHPGLCFGLVVFVIIMLLIWSAKGGGSGGIGE